MYAQSTDSADFKLIFQGVFNLLHGLRVGNYSHNSVNRENRIIRSPLRGIKIKMIIIVNALFGGIISGFNFTENARGNPCAPMVIALTSFDNLYDRDIFAA